MSTDIMAWQGPKTSSGKQSVARRDHCRARHISYIGSGKGFASVLRRMLESWEDYAVRHRQEYESSIGDDGVLGSDWEAIGDGLRSLLNGDTSGWDSGSLDHNILVTMREHGIDTSNK